MVQHYHKLSVDVFYGALKVSEQGYSAGGSAPMGLSRLLLSETREPIQVLKPGERKMISNQRVTGVSAGDEYSEMVERMFTILTQSWLRPDQIAVTLNSQGSRSPKGRPWTASMVVGKLSNEKYAGSQVYNKTWGKLKKKQRSNPREDWIVTPNAFTGIVSRETFLQAQGQLYWMLDSRWRRGIRAVEKMRRIVLTELNELITREDIYTEEERWILLRNFPVTCSVTLSRTTKPQWCFTIPDHLKKFSHVLAVGVNPYKKDSMAERYFLLPTNLFEIGNFHVVAQNDASYSQYLASTDQLEEDAKELLGQVIRLRPFL